MTVTRENVTLLFLKFWAVLVAENLALAVLTW